MTGSAVGSASRRSLGYVGDAIDSGAVAHAVVGLVRDREGDEVGAAGRVQAPLRQPNRAVRASIRACARIEAHIRGAGYADRATRRRFGGGRQRTIEGHDLRGAWASRAAERSG